jgi:hypothetical protein
VCGATNASCGLSFMLGCQPAKSPPRLMNRPTGRSRIRFDLRHLEVQHLVRPTAVVVAEELAPHVPQRPLVHSDDVIQTLPQNGPRRSSLPSGGTVRMPFARATTSRIASTGPAPMQSGGMNEVNLINPFSSWSTRRPIDVPTASPEPSGGRHSSMRFERRWQRRQAE